MWHETRVVKNVTATLDEETGEAVDGIGVDGASWTGADDRLSVQMLQESYVTDGLRVADPFRAPVGSIG